MYKVNKRFYHVLVVFLHFILSWLIGFWPEKDKNVIVELKVRLRWLHQWNRYIYFEVIVLGGAVFATFTLQTLPTAAPVKHNKGTLTMGQLECSASLDAYFELAKRTGLGSRGDVLFVCYKVWCLFPYYEKYIGVRNLTMRKR